ncbi:dockerin type I domain-containing protein [Photobacterium sp. DNB22_13_2]
MKHKYIHGYIKVLLLIVFLSSCGDSDNTEISQSPPSEERTLAIEYEKSLGSVNTVFLLRAAFQANNTSGDFNFIWEVSDGRQLIGEEIEISFATSGVYPIRLIATDRSTSQTYTSGIVINVADGTFPPYFLGISFGDVDNNGTIDQIDADLIKSHVETTSLLDDDSKFNADIDLNGVVDKTDAEIIEGMILEGETWPSHITQSQPQPNTVVVILSESLLDIDTQFELRIFNQQIPINRVIPGYATFIVPESSSGLTSRDSAPTTVEIVGPDNNILEQWEIEVPPAQTLNDFYSQLIGKISIAKHELSLLNNTYGDWFTTTGAGTEDADTLKAVMDGSSKSYIDSLDSLAVFVESLNDNERNTFAQMAVANGFTVDDSQKEILTSVALKPKETCSNNTATKLSQLSDSLKGVGDILDGTTNWLLPSCLAMVVKYPLLATTCSLQAASFTLAEKLITIPISLIPTLSNNLTLSTNTSSIKYLETTNITVTGKFPAAQSLCEGGADVAASKIIGTIAKRIVIAFSKLDPSRLFEQYAELFDDPFETVTTPITDELVNKIISDGLQKILKNLGSKTNLGGALQSACSLFPNGDITTVLSTCALTVNFFQNNGFIGEFRDTGDVMAYDHPTPDICVKPNSIVRIQAEYRNLGTFASGDISVTQVGDKLCGIWNGEVSETVTMSDPPGTCIGETGTTRISINIVEPYSTYMVSLLGRSLDIDSVNDVLIVNNTFTYSEDQGSVTEDANVTFDGNSQSISGSSTWTWDRSTPDAVLTCVGNNTFSGNKVSP